MQRAVSNWSLKPGYRAPEASGLSRGMKRNHTIESYGSAAA
ncbi:hypothetical protein [uncultured Draconibacterium sp.]|nr:hypothetical protein [uncultured Draconibacterium sp.]